MKNRDEIIGYVYQTYKYDSFVRLEDNRDVFSNRLNKLIASISERYICNPIIVNEKREIIDGQGRYEARKSLGLPIHYTIAKGATSDDCRRMNRYNTK
jgi:ParB-like chromosome segregation protein Spo0J